MKAWDMTKAVRVIGTAGLIAGTIDIGAAAAINAINPLIILRFVASGVLGPTAAHGGMASALLGLLLQWGMSVLIAAFYVLAMRQLMALRLHWISAGVAYGAVVFLVMNYLVMPVSMVFPDHHLPHFTVAKFVANLIAMIAFGLMIAFISRHLVGQRTITAEH